MFVLSALIHLLVFGALIGALTQPDGPLVLVILALPVLVLHLCVWACTYLFALAGTLVMALILNAAWVAAGWLYLAPRATWVEEQALTMFFASGLATSVFLIVWMRLIWPRLRESF